MKPYNEKLDGLNAKHDEIESDLKAQEADLATLYTERDSQSAKINGTKNKFVKRKYQEILNQQNRQIRDIKRLIAKMRAKLVKIEGKMQKPQAKVDYWNNVAKGFAYQAQVEAPNYDSGEREKVEINLSTPGYKTRTNPTEVRYKTEVGEQSTEIEEEPEEDIENNQEQREEKKFSIGGYLKEWNSHNSGYSINAQDFKEFYKNTELTAKQSSKAMQKMLERYFIRSAGVTQNEVGGITKRLERLNSFLDRYAE
jgi:hypothetical protein